MKTYEETQLVVEGTSDEQFLLWKCYHDEMEWEQDCMGSGITIGKCDNRPVVVSLSWATINSKIVLFYEGISEVVDHKLVEEFINENFPHADKTNATNFLSRV